jgi:hypothetical protein
MGARLKKFAEAMACFADRIRIGHADAVEAERLCFARECAL